MKQTSGLDALLEALRASGMDMGSGGNPFSKGASGASEADGPDAGSGAGGSGGGRTPHIEVNFAEAMSSWGKKSIIIAIIAIVIIALAAYWWFHPPINIHSTDTWMFAAVFILLPLFLFLSVRSAAYKRGTGKYEHDDKKAKRFKALSFIPVAVALIGVIGAVASLSFFPGNAEKYASILQIEDSNYADDIQEVDYSQIPIIDRDSAALLGERAMGSIPEYVSQFEISPLYSQINYQQVPVRVSPLVYADLFKWLANREQGIPAYVLVDMTTQDTQVVRLDDNPIMYSESEPLVRNIQRHVQLKYPFYMFDEFSFEIDDDGQPWWICPVQDRTIGLFGGKTISRVVMCNATTGECTDIPVEEVPQWVDRVYPADLLIEQYNWHGAYQSGWINSWLGQQGVVRTTPGTDGMEGYNYIAKDDDVWVYSGVTSATADSSIVGFVLMNQRTGESHYYEVAGATEDSAMRSAEGAVQYMGYRATFPLLINVSDQPTYFMALKDNAGTVKMFAMVYIREYQTVAVGDTVEECQEAYKALLAEGGVAVDEGGGDPLDTEQTSGTIARMVSAVIEGNTHFYVMLEGDSTLYDFALPSLLAIVGFAEGDEISFEYLAGDGVCEATQITGGEPATGVSTDVEAPEPEEEPDAQSGNAGAAGGAATNGAQNVEAQSQQAVSA